MLQLDAAMPTPFPLRLLSQQRGCSGCSVPISWRSPPPGIYNSIYLKQGGRVFRLAECVEDLYCSSTIIFAHTRPHVCTNPISRFLLSTLAAEAWRSDAGSAFLVANACRVRMVIVFLQKSTLQHLTDRSCFDSAALSLETT